MEKRENSSNPDKLREEGVNALYESLKINHPQTTLEDCYQIYDKMRQKNGQESDNLQEGTNSQS